MNESTFDPTRAWLKDPDMFRRFSVPDRGQPLHASGLAPATELIVVERGGEKRALLLRQMAYHHTAQGELAGEPYLVSF